MSTVAATSSGSVTISGTGGRSWRTSFSVANLVQVGSRITEQASATAVSGATDYAVYTVLSVTWVSSTSYDLVVDKDCANTGTRYLFKVDVPKVKFDEAVLQEGEDSYAYDVFFTGTHMAQVAPLEVSLCRDTMYTHVNGMRQGVLVEAISEGGTRQKQVIRMTSVEKPASSASTYVYRLVFNDIISGQPRIIKAYQQPGAGASGAAVGFEWGASAGTWQSAIQADASAVGLNVDVTRSGEGSAKQSFGYTYTIAYDRSGVTRQGREDVFSVVGAGQVSTPLYKPFSNETTPVGAPYELTDAKSVANINDLRVKGSLDASILEDMLFIVEISTKYNTYQYVNCAYGTSTLAQCVALTPTAVTAAGNGYSGSLVDPKNHHNISKNGEWTQLGSTGVYINFNNTMQNHMHGDRWAFVATAGTGNGAKSLSAALPTGTSVSSAVVSAGVDGENTMAVTPVYKGSVEAEIPAYKMPPIYTVQSQDVMTLTIEFESQYIGTQAAAFKVASSIDGVGVTSACIDTSGLTEKKLEAALDAMFCPASGYKAFLGSRCTTVVKTFDSVNNPSGWYYKIFLEENSIPYTHDLSALVLTRYTANCGGTDSTANLQPSSTIAKSTYDSASSAFSIFDELTTTRVPLAVSSNSRTMAYFDGADATALPVYKVSGNLWSVTFSSALGDVSKMEAKPTKYLTSGTNLTVYDNVVAGVHPQTYTITGLNAGVRYNARVSAYTSSTAKPHKRGYSSYSTFNRTVTSASAANKVNLGMLTAHATMTPASVTSAVPGQVPSALKYFTAKETLQVSEVQNVIVAASHKREVQTITTAATAYSEVQTITSSASVGQSISGKFTLRYPEVQTVKLSGAASSDVTGSYFTLTYSFMDAGGVTRTAVSSCLSATATASSVETALEAVSYGGSTRVDDVRVVRSGSGGYADSYGYTFTVSFVGDKVAGNVMPLTVTKWGDSVCSAAAPANFAGTVATLNENEAVGLDTEVHTITVNATMPIARGSYMLNYDGTVVTSASCIAWNATAAEMETFITSQMKKSGASYFDAVKVERSGNADRASNWGYTYSVFFTGNRLHMSSGNFEAASSTFNFPSSQSGCDTFSYFNGDGVLQNFAGQSLNGVNIVPSAVRTFANNAATTYQILDLTSTTAATLKTSMAVMPTFVSVSDVRVTLADDQGGFTWTLVYNETLGDAPTLVCSSGATAAGFACTDKTLIQGNYIGGHFIVGTSQLLPAAATATEMKTALEAMTGFGTVAVTRTDKDNQGGYTWTVTWLTAQGDQPALTFSSSLTGSGTTIVGATLQDGNYLGGSYQLEYGGKVSSDISFNASAAQLDAAITAVAGAVTVTRGAVTTEGGSSYLVTFVGATGDVSKLIAHSGKLTGAGKSVTVITETQGSLASGTALKVSFEAPISCAYSQGPSAGCGAPVETYSVELGTSQSSSSVVLPLTPNYRKQRVRVSAPMKNLFYFDDRDAVGTFQLSYNGATTGNINAHGGVTDVREALESLPDVTTVDVSRAYGAEELYYKVSVAKGATSLTCAAGYVCDFNLPAGELIRVGGLWYSVKYTHAYPATSLALAEVGDSSTATSYQGTTGTSLPLYRWSRGYEWTITFLETADGAVAPLSSPGHKLHPVGSELSILSDDCNDCAYVTGLSPWTNYFLKARSRNVHGYSTFSTAVASPKEVPSAPAHVSAVSVSGTEIQVTFAPPAGNSNDVTQYTVEWDTNAAFSNMASTSLTCSGAYGQCQVTGAALTGAPPFKYLIQGLSTANKYYVRVAARNSISISSGMTAANTRWSGVVSATTSDQAPSAPVLVESQTAGPTQMQVRITQPLSTGGSAITNYYIEWSASSSFQDPSTKGAANVTVGSLVSLSSTVKVYEVTGLTSGKTYWVRVSAQNAIGTGATTAASSGQLIAGKPAIPATATLVTATEQTTPITTATASWSVPSSDGGSPITGYTVEWWEDGAVPEVQVVSFTSATYFNPVTAYTSSYHPFKLTYAPSTTTKHSTADLPFSIDAYNVRAALINLGQTDSSNTPTFDFKDLVGDVSVSRSYLTNAGYAWTVTFDSPTTRGDLMPLQASSDGTSQATHGPVMLQVSTTTQGRREFGFAEVQIISLFSTGGTPAATDLSGFFRVSFNGTLVKTPYISAQASAADVERALETLPSLGDVTVVRSAELTGTSSGNTYKGYEWTVTFTGDKGDQPSMIMDSATVATSGTSFLATIYDGNNAIDASTGFKASTLTGTSQTYPGELSKGYNKRVVGPDTFSYTIPDLVPGKKYYASVRAINAFGTGQPKTPSNNYVMPPKQVPSSPTNVRLAVHAGSSTTLDVSYDAPASNGGADIMHYRVELDTSNTFSNPIHSTVYCKPGSTQSVFKIVSSHAATDKITGGSFSLNVKVNGNTYVTEAIPYNAVGKMAEETGVLGKISGVTTGAVITDVNNGGGVDYTANELALSGGDMRTKLFVNDRVKFFSAGGVNQAKYPNQYFIVTEVSATGIKFRGSTDGLTGTGVVLSTYSNKFHAVNNIDVPVGAELYRLTGSKGRSDTGTGSRITCRKESSWGYMYASSNSANFNPYRDKFLDVCPNSREATTGSIEGKLEMIPDIFVKGVEVDRDEPDTNGGVTWRVTFLDPSPAGALNYDVTLNTNSLTTVTLNGGTYSSTAGSSAAIAVTQVNAGTEYTSTCTSTHQVPDGQAITNGQFYYARVFAKNSVGYSLPQIAPTTEKPQVVPGAPTAVTLSVVSDTKLRIIFNPPSSDGGDSITGYKIEYSTSAAFSSGTTTTTYFTFLSGGSPFQKTVSGLTKGTYYYFRVSAGNSQGYGTATASSPSSLNPHTTPDGPTGVNLRQTSASMLTVSFGAPVSNGGDSVSQYRVEWDTASGFNSGSTSPHKGYVDVSASSHSSYTITQLTAGTSYYVRVFAKNSAGLGTATNANPVVQVPALQVPGKPHTLAASTGASSGQISLSWQYPRVPWHGIPCSGTVAAALDCPTEVGGSLASSTGGSAITEYSVQYNELADFTGYDSGEFTTTATSYTLNGLTPGRTYYLRVLARNAQGSGGYCAYTDTNCIVGTTAVSATAKA
jgi:hypothetical protein